MATYTNAIQKLYVAYFNRPADVAGLDWWEGVVAGANGDTSMISAQFAASTEYQQTFAGKSEHEIVRTVYTNLFGREGEPAGVDYWANALVHHLMTIDAVVTEIAKGAQGSDLEAYENKVTAATAFTNALDTHPERAAYNGDEALAAAKAFIKTVTDDASLAAATAPAALATSVAAFVEASRASIELTLTANADTGVAFTGGGGADIFHASAATLSAGDTLKGGGGYDTLYLNDSNGTGLAALPAQVKTTGIESLVAVSGAGFGTAAAAYDLSGQSDMTTMRFAAQGALNLKIGDAVSADIYTTAGAVTVAGGKAISVTGNTGAATLTGNALTTVTLRNTSQDATINNATAGHTLNLGLHAFAGGTVKDAAATTVNLEATLPIVVPAGPADIALPFAGSGSANSVVTDVMVNLDIAKATTLNILNSGYLSLVTTALASADMLKSIKLDGYGSMGADLSGILPFNSFDASGYHGTTSLKIASATNLSVKGGSGVDSIVMTGPLAGTASVQLGAGDDVYDFSRAAQAGAKVDGGVGGNDTMIVNDSVLLDTEGQVFTNFETLVFSNGKGLYNLDKAGSVTNLDASRPLREDVEFINGRANSTIHLVAEAHNVDVNGDPTGFFVPQANITFSLKDASGSNDMLTISLSGQDKTADHEENGTVQASSIEANGIETIHLHSEITATEANFAAADYSNMISYLYLEGARTLTVTGNASLYLSAIYSSTVATFDASGSTGNVDFSGIVNRSETQLTRLTYLGSQGSDSVEGSEVGIVFQGNAGVDELMLYRDGEVADIIRFTKASDSFLVLGAGEPNDQMDTYYYFQSGVDKIDISALHLAAGANRDGFATYQFYSNNYQALADGIGDGIGFFNDGGTNRSLAFASHGGDDGFVMIDVNGDGNFTGGVDMIFNMYGNTEALKLEDFIWG